jgi:hypothetical protein
MATITSTTFANYQPGGLHVGTMSKSGQVVVPATGTAPSAGDVAFLCKIPHGAVIVDFMEDHTCADTIGISFGLATGGPSGQATLSALISSGAKATFNRRNVVNTGGGVTVSVSDNDPSRYGVLSAKIESGSLTASVTINWTVLYRYDRNAG